MAARCGVIVRIVVPVIVKIVVPVIVRTVVRVIARAVLMETPTTNLQVSDPSAIPAA